MRRFISTVIRNTVFINILLVVILLLGAVASQVMVREVFPEISAGGLMVVVPYPGADPEEVEEGISRKIEAAIDGIEGIERYTTVSAENRSRTAIQVYEGYPVSEVYTEVRNAIDSISTFPLDAEKPIISEMTINDEVILLAIAGDQPERTLKEMAERVKDEIQALPSVSQVTIFGTREYEIAIEVSEEKLREYGLSFRKVSDAVSRSSLNLSGGLIRTRGEEIRLRTIGRKYSGQDFASIVVLASPDGEIITLDRVAAIKDGFVEDEIRSRFNGQNAVMLGVFKVTGEDAIAIVEEVRRYVERKQAQVPQGMSVTLWGDRSQLIHSRVNLLVRNGLIGLSIVFLSLWLFLELRLSFWVTMGIPVSLSGGLLLMWLVGATINEVSLFGLIMVLGIVVDDAIIVGEAIYVARKRGDGPLLAATNGVMEVGLPVFAAVTTTIVAFIPLMFLGGVMGRFIKIMPIAVIAALTVSLIESLFLLPGHLNHLPDFKQRESTPHGLHEKMRRRISDGLEWFVQQVYLPSVHGAIHFRYVALCTAIFVLFAAIGLVRGGFVKYVLFPEVDAPDLLASIEFPQGTPISVTQDAVRKTEEGLLRAAAQFALKDGHPLIRNVHAVTGEGGGGQFDNRGVGNHLGRIRVELAKSHNRTVLSEDFVVAWEEAVGPIPGALLQSFAPLEMGPPGAPIEVELKGEDSQVLLAVAEEIKAKLRTYDGVYQVSDSFRPGKKELRIDLKPEARTLGLTLEDLARQVHAGYYGSEALRLQRGRDDIRVKVRYPADQRGTLAHLEQVRIRTPQGKEVPFFSVADVEFATGYAGITRVDGMKSISVTAQNDAKRANPDEILEDLRITCLGRLSAEYPGFSWSFEGAQKDSRDAFTSLYVSFPIALVGIFVIVATVFRSYVQPIVIMITIPFGIIGAIFGHLVMGESMTMVSIFGMVALTGIVVNDAIVLIEAINKLIAEGVPVFEALCRGGARRFRAILLTSLSTVGGLLPLILETEAEAQMLVPMALSIAAGVVFATLLTLVFVPCLLGILNDLRRVVYWLLHQTWPTRELVEPAILRNLDPLLEGMGQPLTAQ